MADNHFTDEEETYSNRDVVYSMDAGNKMGRKCEDHDLILRIRKENFLTHNKKRRLREYNAYRTYCRQEKL